MQVAQRMTADEYLALDLEPRHELIDGLIVVNEPRLIHALLAKRLLTALDEWTRVPAAAHGLVTIPIDVGVDRYNVYAPDLLWYSAARAPAIDSPWPYPLPDLAIEIRSPSTWRYDIGAKTSAYEREGLPELLLVDGDAGAVLVFRRSNAAARTFDVMLEFDRSATLTSPLLPGFALAVGALFDFG